MEAEGVTDLDSVDTYEIGDFVQYGFPHDADGENPAMYVYYIFKNDHARDVLAAALIPPIWERMRTWRRRMIRCFPR